MPAGEKDKAPGAPTAGQQEEEEENDIDYDTPIQMEDSDGQFKGKTLNQIRHSMNATRGHRTRLAQKFEGQLMIVADCPTQRGIAELDRLTADMNEYVKTITKAADILVREDPSMRKKIEALLNKINDEDMHMAATAHGVISK